MSSHEVILLNGNPQKITPNGMHSGMDITIQNLSTEHKVFIGGEGLTQTSFGFVIEPRAAISFELPPRDFIYALSEDIGQIAVMKMGLE